MNKFFSKIVLLLVAFAALFLQGCAATPNLVCASRNGCKSANENFDEVWRIQAERHNVARRHGARLADDGKTVLTPVHGAKGVYQYPNGYRAIDESDCQKEGGGAAFFWGVLVPTASLLVGGQYTPTVCQTVGGAVRQRGATARYYSCEDMKKFLVGGNSVLQEMKTEELKKQCANEGGFFNPQQGSCTLPQKPQNSATEENVEEIEAYESCGTLEQQTEKIIKKAWDLKKSPTFSNYLSGALNASSARNLMEKVCAQEQMIFSMNTQCKIGCVR